MSPIARAQSEARWEAVILMGLGGEQLQPGKVGWGTLAERVSLRPPTNPQAGSTHMYDVQFHHTAQVERQAHARRKDWEGWEGYIQTARSPFSTEKKNVHGCC
uniref:Uncharacterized protein n=1 Tax=Bionectria ochroleuca TaxID=29856 RepID=A0A8H7N374_BIOOC